MTTTQVTRALIARLQARLGEGTPTPVTAVPDGTRKIKGTELVPIYTLAFNDVGPGDVEALVGYVQPYDARPIAVALNELPGQIARWLKRLDEADELCHEAAGFIYPHDKVGPLTRAETILATVTEDVQAWEAQIERLGVDVINQEPQIETRQ